MKTTKTLTKTRTWLVLVALCGNLALFSGTEAFAHARLVKSDPPLGATVAADQAPKVVTLEFSEDLEMALCKVSVRKDLKNGTEIPVGKIVVAADHPRSISIPILAPLAPGRYFIVWRAVSSDSHKVHGEYSFTVR